MGASSVPTATFSPVHEFLPVETQGHDEEQFNQIYAALYSELRRLAMHFRQGCGVTISATELVNDAYLKLFSSPARSITDRLHIKRIAAKAMRQILVDAARRRRAAVHGGLLQFVSLTHSEAAAPAPNPNLLDLHLSLRALAEAKPRMAEIVELRYFGGFSVEEIRKAVGLSDATVEREIRAAVAWLSVKLDNPSTCPG